MKTRKLDVTVSAHTSATPEQVLEAATDFSRRRAQLWPNVRAKRLKVHDSGPQWADVTEATWIIGVFWERYRYDWSEPGKVNGVVTDSNIFGAGSVFEVRATPADDGADVEMTVRRTFRSGFKGRFASVANRSSGTFGWRTYLKVVLRRIEKEQAQAGRRARGPLGARSRGGATAA
jgi:hypothetical protein